MPKIIHTTIPPEYIKIKSGFERLAPFYEYLLYIFGGYFFRKAENSLINQLKNAENVLIIGGGKGHFLKELVKACKGKHYTYIDISERMVKSSDNRMSGMSESITINYIVGNWDVINHDKTYDLICTNYFLDLFPEAEVKQIVSYYSPRLKTEGEWLVTDLYPPHGSRIFKSLGLLYIRALYLFFKYTTSIKAAQLPEVDNIFREYGYFRATGYSSGKGLIRSFIFKKLT